MPIDPVLPHDLDDEFGPGAEDADTEADDFDALEELVCRELIAVIGNYEQDKRLDTVRDLQPTTATVKAMATAAAQVLIAFEHGYRLCV